MDPIYFYTPHYAQIDLNPPIGGLPFLYLYYSNIYLKLK